MYLKPSNKSLDESRCIGMFRIMTGAAKGALIRAAAILSRSMSVVQTK